MFQDIPGWTRSSHDIMSQDRHFIISLDCLRANHNTDFTTRLKGETCLNSFTILQFLPRSQAFVRSSQVTHFVLQVELHSKHPLQHYCLRWHFLVPVTMVTGSKYIDTTGCSLALPFAIIQFQSRRDFPSTCGSVALHRMCRILRGIR